MTQYDTAQNIVNRVAPEVGLSTTSNLFTSTDQTFIQLRNLLKSCGQELLTKHHWEALRREWTFTTDGTSTYSEQTLPTEWAYVIPATAWDRTKDVPMSGPLTPQEWQYLEGREMGSDTIFIGYRFTQRKLFLYPQPPPSGIVVALEYISRNWALANDGITYRDGPTANDDTILYPDVLMVKMLKAKFMGARGFDTTKADNEFKAELEGWTGSLEGSKILSASRKSTRSVPLLDARFNTRDTGYG
jgi:hypothetical protein